MNSLGTKSSDEVLRDPVRPTRSSNHPQEKGQQKSLQYLVPGLYLTPYGHRRGCLKARG